MKPREHVRAVEQRVRSIAEHQDGVVTRPQLLEAGCTDTMIRARVRAGHLRRLHQGTYLLGFLAGPLLPPRYRERAAVLASGAPAVVSHHSAAAMLDLIPPRPSGEPVDLLVVGGTRRRAGVRSHRVPALPSRDLTSLDGIPLTTPLRTLLDLSRVAANRELENAVARAERRGITTRGELLDRAVRAGARPGACRLRALLEAGSRPAFTRSVAEEQFLRLVREAGLPEPETNVRVEGHEVDFVWPARGVAVEIDGFAFHASRASFERDRKRDLILSAAGLNVARVTWRQLQREPLAVIARLAATLARAR